MTETVTVEIPLDVAREFARNCYRAEDVKKAVKKALPPEYPEGTIAWVTSTTGVAWLSVRGEGRWGSASGGRGVTAHDRDVAKVEVLQVAGAGEIVVPDPSLSRIKLREAARTLDENYQYTVGEFLRSVANRL